MKIGYIYISSGNQETSVSKKVTGQVERLNQIEGVSCKGLFFSHAFSKDEVEGDLIKIKVEKTSKKYFNNLHQNEANYKGILEYLKKHSSEYTHFYLRHNASTKTLVEITKLDINLTIEINGNLPVTIPKQKKKVKSVSDVFHNIGFYYLPFRNEKKYGRLLFNNTRISSTSYELYDLFKKFYRIKRDRFFVIGNGIDLEKIPVRKFIKEQKNEFRILILKGAAIKADYLGLDRVLKGIQAFQSDEIELKLICAGKHFSDEEKMAKELNITERIEFVGYLNREQMGKYVDSSDIAISSLATYRSGIMEISSLKTRDYFSRGIPFVYGYTDTDLMNIGESREFAMQVSNEASPLDFNKIVAHFNPIILDEEHPKKMRQIAENYLAMDKKMVNLAQEICKENV